MICIWRVWGTLVGLSPLTCEIWYCLQVDSVRIELSCRTPSWSWRIVCWNGEATLQPPTWELGAEPFIGWLSWPRTEVVPRTQGLQKTPGKLRPTGHPIRYNHECEQRVSCELSIVALYNSKQLEHKRIQHILDICSVLQAILGGMHKQWTRDKND